MKHLFLLLTVVFYFGCSKECNPTGADSSIKTVPATFFHPTYTTWTTANIPINPSSVIFNKQITRKIQRNGGAWLNDTLLSQQVELSPLFFVRDSLLRLSFDSIAIANMSILPIGYNDETWQRIDSTTGRYYQFPDSIYLHNVLIAPVAIRGVE